MKPLWIPDAEHISNSNITAFSRYVEQLTGKSIKSYEDIYNWSVDDIEEFWKSIWILSGIIHSKSYNKILTSYEMPGAKWFEGAELNFAENLLRFRDDNIAIISSRENQITYKLTYKKLYELTASVAASLRELGVKKGDRVAAFITNIPEAIIGMLAAASIGALWSSCSPDFGLQGVLDRFGQIKPKILFAIESYQYNGKTISCMEKIEQISERIPQIEHIIIVSKFDDLSGISLQTNKLSKNDKYLKLKDLLRITSTTMQFEQLSFEYPVYIMYSSGTTGIPKCIVHSAGGTLLQHFKELSLHTDLKRNDIITYFTTCGWMMWNWMVSSLMVGASIFLYDGSPVYPSVSFLWQKIEEEKITIFGTSPKYLTICEKNKYSPTEEFNLESLRIILSTGSPLSEENFNWVYKNVKNNVQLSSISGGTDIISCFMLGNPNLPVYAGEIQSRGLGMKVEALNDEGKSVIEEKGELVCTKPFPSMPVFFWNDVNNEKYRQAYFEHFAGIWRHGDFIKITKHGGVIVYGRSDATLNPGGVRIGTAEIYRVVESMDEILDSLVIGQNYKNDVRIILFIIVKEGTKFNEDFISEIKNKIKNEATPRHVPYKIIQVDDIPRTISGKKVELAVTKIIHGEEVENKDALANPDSLKQFYEIRKTVS